MGIEVATLGHPTIEPIAVFSFHVVTGIGIKDAAIYKATFEVGAMETIRGKQLLVGLWRHDSIGIVGIKSAQERFENEISRALDDFENDWLAANPGVRPGRR